MRRRPLNATEVADAAMTAALVMALQTVGRLIAAGTFFQVFSTLSMTVLATRHRGRVVLMATIAAMGMVITLGGLGPISHAVIAGTMGYANGTALRRNYGLVRHVGRALLLAWPTISAIGLLFLLVFSDLRELTLENARNNWDGITKLRLPLEWLDGPVGWLLDTWYLGIPLLAAVGVYAITAVRRFRKRPVPPLGVVATGWLTVCIAAFVGVLALGASRSEQLDDARARWEDASAWVGERRLPVGGLTPAVEWIIEHWWVFVPAGQLIVTIGYSLIVRRLGRVIVQRVDHALGADAEHFPRPAPQPADALPLQLDHVSVRRRSHTIDLALTHDVAPQTFSALLGPNGAGKTTLLDAIGGLVAADGVVHDGPGLGLPGGTAMISQRPETHVLGVRVIDDIRWGLDDLRDEVATDLLHRVGLDGRATQPTSELSGGELQRLAIASALAREPALVLSDESTAMLDPDGRAAVVDLLRDTARAGAAVIHSTHLDEDIAQADDSIVVGPPATLPPHEFATRPRPDAKVVLAANGVGFVHSDGTPWATRVLSDVDLSVGVGQLIVVRGSNGSGKTTLARLLAGLAWPTEGTVELHGTTLRRPDRRIGIAFQHARLQMLRSRLGTEVDALAGTPDTADALRVLGFDPGRDRSRRIDELSGGQQRRVLLAGLLARRCDVVILDEPLAGLDADGRTILTGAIDAWLQLGTGVVVVSHDPRWALERADRVLDLDAHAAQHREVPA